MTPDELRRLIDRTEQEALDDLNPSRAALRLARAEHLKRVLAELERLQDHPSGLTSSNQSGNVNEPMLTERESVRRSAARPSKSRLVDAANDAGWSLRALADELGDGASHTTLSQAAEGTKRIRESHALKVQQLLGKDKHGKWRWPATRQSWPKGWVEGIAKK